MPDAPTDDALLHLFSQHPRKLPLAGGVDEEGVPVVLERPRTPSSSSQAPAVPAAVEKRCQDEYAAAAVADKVDQGFLLLSVELMEARLSHSDFSNEAEQELPEDIYIDLQEIRKEVQCPICLGIIKKTRTVMECLHRFCRQCIDKSMRMGNNECPACRIHCASRRSLRDDPRFDAFITALFPDIEKYEHEELAFCEEERTRNKQIQVSIAEILKLQSEALGKKRSSRKGTRVASPSRSQRNNSDTPSRRSKRRRGKTLLEESDDNEDTEITEGQTSSFSGEHSKDIDQYRHNRRIGSSRPPSPATSSEMENKLSQKSSHPGIMRNVRAWGKGGARSHIQHAIANGLKRKNPPSTHINKLVEFLQNLEKQHDEYVASEMPTGADTELIVATEPPGLHHRQGTDSRNWPHLSSRADNASLPVVSISRQNHCWV